MAAQLPHFPVKLWSEENGWQDKFISSEGLNSENASAVPPGIPSNTKVFVITADSTEIRTCQEIRRVFQNALCMPDLWWVDCFEGENKKDYLSNANGYFGCESTESDGEFNGFNTWAFFEAKQFRDEPCPGRKDYYWSKIAVFSRWIASTQQMGILLLKSEEHISSFDFKPSPRELLDPFWFYPCIFDRICSLQESAIWGIRDKVRNIELKKRDLSGKNPKPHYENLHEIGRHAIHVSESIEVTVGNFQEIINQHQSYVTEWKTERHIDSPQSGQTDKNFWQPFNIHRSIGRRLAFFGSLVGSLSHRAKANEKRLQNEIQLAYNLISQRDTAATVEIGEATVEIGDAARKDSATMKTLSFVTLIFLPPTFISTLFGMQFFNYDKNNGFFVAEEFWIYWVIAIPTTIGTALIWIFWSELFPRHAGSYFHRLHSRKDIEQGGGENVEPEKIG